METLEEKIKNLQEALEKLSEATRKHIIAQNDSINAQLRLKQTYNDLKIAKNIYNEAYRDAIKQ